MAQHILYPTKDELERSLNAKLYDKHLAFLREFQDQELAQLFSAANQANLQAKYAQQALSRAECELAYQIAQRARLNDCLHILQKYEQYRLVGAEVRYFANALIELSRDISNLHGKGKTCPDDMMQAVLDAHYFSQQLDQHLSVVIDNHRKLDDRITACDQLETIAKDVTYRCNFKRAAIIGLAAAAIATAATFVVLCVITGGLAGAAGAFAATIPLAGGKSAILIPSLVGFVLGGIGSEIRSCMRAQKRSRLFWESRSLTSHVRRQCYETGGTLKYLRAQQQERQKSRSRKVNN